MHSDNCMGIHSFKPNEKLFKRQVLLRMVHLGGSQDILSAYKWNTPCSPYASWESPSALTSEDNTTPQLPQTTSSNALYSCQWGNNQQGLLIQSKNEWSHKLRGVGNRKLNAFSWILRGTGADGQEGEREWTHMPNHRGNYQVNELSANGLSAFGYKLKVIPTFRIFWFCLPRSQQ